MDSVVALFSGGLDSALMIDRLIRAGARVFPLYVRQGALWEEGEECAARGFLASLQADEERLSPLTVLRLDLPPRYASRWAVDSGTPPPDAVSPDQAVYLPGRNLGLLAMGAMLAQSLGVSRVAIGVLSTNPFGDGRDCFFRAFEHLYALATGYSVAVEAPLRATRKARLLAEAGALALGNTLSCLRPSRGLHCGRCNKCAERRRAFAEAGLADSTRYIAD